MKLYIWIPLALLVLFVLSGIRDERRKARAKKVIPDILDQGGWMPARELQVRLIARDAPLHGASFYHLMNKLEECGIVECHRDRDEDGPFRRYRLRRDSGSAKTAT